MRSRSGREPAPVTIADVARHAGVSASTVSYVLSGKRAISAVTRARVLASVRALGFHPHAGARALAGNRSHIIALALPLRSEVSVTAVLRFAAAVVEAARACGYDVLLVPADGLRRVADSALVDGIVAMEVANAPRPVRLSRPSVLVELPADIDLETADTLGRLAVDRLVAAA
ncbi:LacI family DNA-binding transcriptional regulator [Actinoplanes bogorensis]|uniref:LacI family DNA-binding transcriptional regulator n=1 Tax=Paractinoplanes bogorensis TaxID=1610840 RepID=A0ABS5Z3Q1_9ACTN|nr:LacI family DNA-binding transcriptional regulator [Actinoplanes bogorensis]MBU2670316.1 LacI family DNA-binding transcriptional regulator [Actinoplanes bogorensis]